ncbi:helix-turn-helix domain-containing protein [Streptomyces cylindrosporus]|uniref:XRE family transcriptional regulator n=1 Tax=Streptomyces cylindrosporus TaxID=2927583 RepID=A0ABS9YMK5_9ACTN|nr:XRE family transcriptional regulator [Streptomyces cylindrosporus]MCI3277795.1 XRE family transcriptional regulator [Streptomyces cylindrosporus]
MSNIVDPLVRQIADRVRTERERRRWTLAQLADASGVSQAMISRIERGESSPTAVVLGKLSAAFQLSVSSLLALAEGTAEGTQGDSGDIAGVRRQADAAEWRDPDTGYRRRQITGPQFPAEIAEIHLPAGARVPYPAAAFVFVRQVVWVLDGRLTFHDGDTVHELDAGDTIELGDPTPRVFANTTDADCRYAVILTRATQP